jgi:hypothetical protein
MISTNRSDLFSSPVIFVDSKRRKWPRAQKGQREGNYDSDRFRSRTLRYSLRRVSPLDSVNWGTHNLMLLGIPWSSLGILIYAVELLQIGRPAQQCTGRSLVKVGGTYVARAIRQYRTKPLKLGEGVETGWRAPLVGEGTVRLSSKGESDRITQRSAVQIRPPQP